MSGIEWTEMTWNPLRGCSRVSAGCEHCYAETHAGRFCGPGQLFEGYATRVNGRAHWTRRVDLLEHKLMEPLGWRKPRSVFVNSMSDLFHEGLLDEAVDDLFAVMLLATIHTFQVLTKRAERMAAYLADPLTEGRVRATAVGIAREAHRRSAGRLILPRTLPWPLPNVWIGVSAEDQPTWDARVPELLSVAALGWHTWVSLEPLLGAVNVGADLAEQGYESGGPAGWVSTSEGIGTIVLGGESGPGARPMHPDWARAVRDQCEAAGVPFFFKQHGAWTCARLLHSHTEWVGKAATNSQKGDRFIDAAGRELRIGRDFMECTWPMAIMRCVGKKAAGRLLDGRTHDDLGWRK